MVDEKITIVELLEEIPESREILSKYGLHCVGCMASRFETLKEGCMAHGMDEETYNKMMKEIDSLTKPQDFIVEVSSIEEFSSDIRIIKFSVEGFSFLPGAYVLLWQEGYLSEGKVVKRAYSIASSNKEKGFEVCFKIDPLGMFSKKVNSLQVGDKLNMKGPFNAHFVLKPSQDPAFIVAGTGIAPVMSMIRSRDLETTLIYSIKTEKNYIYEKELEKFPNIKKVICVTRQDETKFVKGRITKEIISENLKDTNKDVFICGPKEMVENCLSWLNELGFTKIHVEKWG